MSIAKVIFIAPIARIRELNEKHFMLAPTGLRVSYIDATSAIIAGHPIHDHTRSALAAEADVVVLKTAHDPEPIGDDHKHLAHVEAKPEETMRSVALRLAVKHGPAFSPDT